MTSLSQSQEARREARIAAAKARRAEAPTCTEIEVPVTQVQPGDYLVKVPSQGGLRGAIYGALVDEALHVHAGQTVRGLHSPASGVAIVTHRWGAPGEAIWPSNFIAVVRRAS